MDTEERQLEILNLEQQHDYLRTTFRQLLTWFLTFSTFNMTALAASAYAIANAPEMKRWVYAVVACYMVPQCILGCFSCQLTRSSLRDTARAIEEGNGRLRGGERTTTAGEPSLSPAKDYRAAAIQMIIALLMTSAIWLAILVFACS